jgi:hypothetical protein
MPTPELKDANLDLLIQIDRLLTEADRTRELRDRLFEAARKAPPVSARMPADEAEGAAHA